MRKKNLQIIILLFFVMLPSISYSWGTDDINEDLFWTLKDLRVDSYQWSNDNNPFSTDADSYYVRTHPILTWKIIKFYEEFIEQNLPASIKSEIIWGSIEEDYDVEGTSDVPGFSNLDFGTVLKAHTLNNNDRCTNHFIGTDNEPLTDPATIAAFPGRTTSLIWADYDDRNTMRFENLVDLYRSNPQKAWAAVGHILHLFEDCSSPAHVRNDGHVGGDIYEDTLQNLTPAKHEELFNDIALYGFQQYEPYNAIDRAFTFLSDYTRSHYFSNDTVKKTEFWGITLPEVELNDDRIPYTVGAGTYYLNDEGFPVLKKGVSFQINYQNNFNKYMSEHYLKNPGITPNYSLLSQLAYNDTLAAEKADWTCLDEDVVKASFPDLAEKTFNYGIGLLKACIEEIKMIDADIDGILDENDNCPDTYNPYQYDADGDGVGDSCQIIDDNVHVVPTEYQTIIEAVADSSSGDTIKILAGDHIIDEVIDLPHPLVFEGEGAELTKIHAGSNLIGQQLITAIYISGGTSFSGIHFIDGGIQARECKRIDISRNLFENPNGFAIALDDKWACGSSTAYITNNTIINCQKGIRTNDWRNLYMYNNIIVDCTTGFLEYDVCYKHVEYNNFYNCDTVWTGSGTLPANNFTFNPQLVTQNGTNGYLSEGSPCIDAGHPDSSYNDPDGSRNDIGVFPY